MKKIFIIAGVSLALTILGVWVYLFMYGTPKSASDVFARFGGNAGENVVSEPIAVEPEESSDEAPKAKKLRQLTLKPTIGAVFVDNTIRYVEAGTGHVYSIDLTTNNETLLTGTTIQKAREAIFSKDGSQVAITSLDNSAQQTVVGTIDPERDAGNLKGYSLPVGARDIHFGTATNTIEFVLSGTQGTVGYSYNDTKRATTELFRVPLRDIRILWGNPLYVYTTPTSVQEGYAYKIKDGKFEYVTQGGVGLLAFKYNSGIIVTTANDTAVTSRVVTHTGETNDGARALLPEKCVTDSVSDDYIFCAVPENISVKEFPDRWYKGVISYSDSLWKIGTNLNSSELLVYVPNETGREVDVLKIGISQDGTKLWFINKNDNTLWMYDMSVEE